MTPAGIEPATFLFVAQHLNHCPHVRINNLHNGDDDDDDDNDNNSNNNNARNKKLPDNVNLLFHYKWVKY